MRISDWSSDVCSSDLLTAVGSEVVAGAMREANRGGRNRGIGEQPQRIQRCAAIEVDFSGACTEFAAVSQLSGQPAAGDAGGEVEAVEAEIRAQRRVHHIVGEQRTDLGVDHHLRATGANAGDRSEEHTSELQSLMRHSYAVFCLK